MKKTLLGMLMIAGTLMACGGEDPKKTPEIRGNVRVTYPAGVNEPISAQRFVDEWELRWELVEVTFDKYDIGGLPVVLGENGTMKFTNGSHTNENGSMVFQGPVLEPNKKYDVSAKVSKIHLKGALTNSEKKVTKQIDLLIEKPIEWHCAQIQEIRNAGEQIGEVYIDFTLDNVFAKSEEAIVRSQTAFDPTALKILTFDAFAAADKDNDNVVDRNELDAALLPKDFSVESGSPETLWEYIEYLATRRGIILSGDNICDPQS